MAQIIGRKEEIAQLLRCYEKKESQLVAIYGRRRVGKTFLVDEALKGKITFRHAGLSPVDQEGKRNSLREQLKNFYFSLQRHGMPKSKCPTSWMEAFYALETLLDRIDNNERQVLFFDELPWMDTPKSGFLTAFESFWNGWGCHKENLMVVVCGSANSWILDKLINNHGGLYNRLSASIKLSPFTFKECEEFFASREIQLSRYDILQSQMILGGVPYYLDLFKKGYSFSQNIDSLFWGENAKLSDEFSRLFASVFSNPEEMKKIVLALSENRKGLTRSQIARNTRIELNGELTRKLKALSESDFIVKYFPFGESRREPYYKLTDPFCMFHSKFIENKNITDPYYWTDNQTSQNVVAWRGFAFEDLCFRHIRQIKAALGISGVATEHSAWCISGDGNNPGNQIDLIILRKDNVANLCEMKYYSGDFTVTGDYYKTILNRRTLLSDALPKKYAVHSTLVTTFGLKYNSYSGVFQKTITLDDLFE